ncbi:DUF805 domain-containing protein [Microlunatus flavus]|uniref:Uncharacterized membrane protein YhaH, DUF805 family n=1 Tax=Microlunatus flavus TaxID=1036181 RepID=A0A1H9AHF9_9ACTN|nr:DUF805 domain-containing protein [Microlunatus flavus]SEP76174.1 Uncharacterized membrane protein YhaH, DUF805 family [Microlunatus flavus]
MSSFTQGGEPPLDWPWYGIGFGAAIKRFFTKYATFSGRASRGEYWWAYLFQVVVVFVLYALAGASLFAAATASSATGATPQMGPLGYIGSSLLSLFALGTIVPSLAVAVRRLHDTGRSGWYILFGLIPLVGGIIVIVFLASATTPAAEQYGPPQTGYGAPGAGYGQGQPQAYGQGYPQQ